MKDDAMKEEFLKALEDTDLMFCEDPLPKPKSKITFSFVLISFLLYLCYEFNDYFSLATYILYFEVSTLNQKVTFVICNIRKLLKINFREKVHYYFC